MRIDVIVNTTARRYQARPSLLDRVANACSGAATLHPTSSLQELEQVSHEIAQRGTDLVILSGGDGSFMAGVTTLAHAFGETSLPRVALLPGGTAATVARNWGMRGDPAELLGKMLHSDGVASQPASSATMFMDRPSLRVRAVTPRGSENRIGFIFGTGLVARFFDRYYAGGGHGYVAAAGIVTRIFVESFYGGPYAKQVLEPLPCTIEVEGRTLAASAWSLVCAAVVRDLGIHMQVTYRGGEDVSRPHLVASCLPPRELGPRVMHVLAGKRIGGRGHFDDLVRDFVVRFGNNASPAKGPYILDGDMFEASEVHVCAGPTLQVFGSAVK